MIKKIGLVVFQIFLGLLSSTIIGGFGIGFAYLLATSIPFLFGCMGVMGLIASYVAGNALHKLLIDRFKRK